ncbi:MAG TPA: ABC-2 family transporter protein [Clostridia bacterium]|nr:ABC-2 family transporter protein [Clostridia bacterium]
MNGIAATLKTCLSIFRIKTAESLQYRMAGLAGATTSIFFALIEITVYTVFYKYSSNQNAGLAAGLSLRQAVSYVWLGQLLFLMQPNFIESDILGKINSGDIGVELCRPLDLYANWFARTASTRLSPLLWRGLPIIFFAVIMPPAYRLELPSSLSGMFCSLISTVSALLLCTSFGMLACSVRLGIAWGEGPTNIIMLAGSVLSGAYLPLQLWPGFLQGFLLFQPFAGYLDIPMRLYLGTMPPSDAFWAIGLQLAWALLFAAAGKAIMARKLRNIVIQGG